MASSYIKQLRLVSIFAIWRLALFTPLILGAYLISPNITTDFTYMYNPFGSFFVFNSLWLIIERIIFLPWANFDGIHYLNIAQYGYLNQARFFPLFPLLITVLAKPVQIVFSSPLLHFFTGFLLVNLIFLTTLLIFKRLIEIDFPKEVSAKSILYLLIFPASFFFVAIYSEGLFLLLTLLTFYFARKKQWLLSAICASLLTATRFVGIAILPALLYEFAAAGFKIKRLILFAVAPVGLICYSVFNYYKWHNFLYFIQAQGELGNNRSVSSIVLFPQTIFRYIKILLTVPVNSLIGGIALLELVSFLFAAILLYLAWKKKIRTSYLIFALVNFAITISTGTFSGLPRYVLTLFPVFIALALVKNKLFQIIYMIISAILLFILTILFTRGYYVA